MAIRLDEFPVEVIQRSRWKYPWDEWTDGHAWLLIRGEDFDPKAERMRGRCYAQAKRRGLAVRTSKLWEPSIDGERPEREGLFIQFFPREEGPPEVPYYSPAAKPKS